MNRLIYQSLDDRRILRVRDAQVVEATNHPGLLIKLSNGVALHYQGQVDHTFGASDAPDVPRRDFMTFEPDHAKLLEGTRPLSWVVFDTGDHRIVFSNTWMLALDPHPAGSWRLDFPDSEPWTYP